MFATIQNIVIFIQLTIFFILFTPSMQFFIYTYHDFNDTFNKMRVPTFSHEKSLEGTRVLADLEFLVVSRKRRGDKTVT